MKILTLTDHTTHGEGESIYKLLSSLNNHRSKPQIYVASRGHPENQDFFECFNTSTVYAKAVDSDFFFTRDRAWFDSSSTINLDQFDGFFLRIDRPFSNGQLSKLSDAAKGRPVINNPVGIQTTGSKRFLLNFPDLTPPCGLLRTVKEAHDAASERAIVIKPIEGYGGTGLLYMDKSTFKVGDRTVDRTTLERTLQEMLRIDSVALWMEYLPQVTQGDKRILVVGDQVIGATLRMPAKGSWLCNLKQGGTATSTSIDPEEYAIASSLQAPMTSNGVVIYGFDTLVGPRGKRVLSEVNSLNVGGFLQAEGNSSTPIFYQAADQIMRAFSTIV
ncbi:MAG: ATP-grasp domain-containing protein [Gammaproteobacteria bacterium]